MKSKSHFNKAVEKFASEAVKHDVTLLLRKGINPITQKKLATEDKTDLRKLLKKIKEKK